MTPVFLCFFLNFNHFHFLSFFEKNTRTCNLLLPFSSSFFILFFFFSFSSFCSFFFLFSDSYASVHQPTPAPATPAPVTHTHATPAGFKTQAPPPLPPSSPATPHHPPPVPAHTPVTPAPATPAAQTEKSSGWFSGWGTTDKRSTKDKDAEKDHTKKEEKESSSALGLFSWGSSSNQSNSSTPGVNASLFSPSFFSTLGILS